MSARWENFKDGVLREFSDELFEIAKGLDAVNDSIGASEDAFKKQTEIVTQFSTDAIQRIEDYLQESKKATDADIAEAFSERGHEARKEFDANITNVLSNASAQITKDFDVNITRVLGSTTAQADKLNVELGEAMNRFKALEKYGATKSTPTWAKVLIGVGIGVIFACPPAAYMLGQQVAVQNTDNMIMSIVSMSPDELDKAKKQIEELQNQK